jgi:hypothetical protein
MIQLAVLLIRQTAMSMENSVELKLLPSIAHSSDKATTLWLVAGWDISSIQERSEEIHIVTWPPLCL